MSSVFVRRVTLLALLLPCFAIRAHATECDNYQTAHPQWLWCDSFESEADLDANYFDVNRADGRMQVSADGPFDGSFALKSTYVPGELDAGGIKLSFGATPVSPKRYTDKNFDEIYWRFYMKTSGNWVGQAFKVTRATVFSSADWRQAAIGHLWEDSATSLGMGLDPASGVVGSTVVTTTYNDFAHLQWLGKSNGAFQMYAADNRGKWTCVEVHMKLNTPGKADGLLAFAVNGQQQAEADNLNFRGSYTTYGINAILLESYIGSGSVTQSQSRWFDNFVVSTQPVGCMDTAAVLPNPPSNVTVQ